MAGVNKVILVGRLGKEPEVRTLDNGAKVASFPLATSESYNDKNTGERKEITEWHNIVMWRGLAELAEKYLEKGREVYIEGRLQTRTYEQDSVTKYRTEIIANQMQFLGSKGDNSGVAPSPSPSSQSSSTASPSLASTDDAKDDLPF